jgi:hypothetical protein
MTRVHPYWINSTPSLLSRLAPNCLRGDRLSRLSLNFSQGQAIGRRSPNFSQGQAIGRRLTEFSHPRPHCDVIVPVLVPVVSGVIY